jgi:hypothetical protein
MMSTDWLVARFPIISRLGAGLLLTVHFTAIVTAVVSFATTGRAFTEAKPFLCLTGLSTFISVVVCADTKCDSHRAYMANPGLRRRRYLYPKNARYSGEDDVAEFYVFV